MHRSREFLILAGLIFIPLAIAWRIALLFRQRLRGETLAWTTLFVTTASYLYFILGWIFPRSLGPEYSDYRIWIPLFCHDVSLAMFVLSLATKSPFRKSLATAAGLLTLSWLIALWFNQLA